jgi:hypothetical protein
MLRKQEPFYANLIKLYFPKLTRASAHFHFDEEFAEDWLHIQFLCRQFNMMYDVMLCEMKW